MISDLFLLLNGFASSSFDRTGVPCILSLKDIEDVSPKASLTLFRIIQEALTNVIRHSEASEVSITLDEDSDIVLTISDNGIGIPEEKIQSGKSFGIMGMKQRIQQCGGSITFVNNENKGTSIIVKVPKNQSL